MRNTPSQSLSSPPSTSAKPSSLWVSTVSFSFFSVHLNRSVWFWRGHMWPWTTKPVMRVNYFEIKIYASSESWINNLSIDVWFVMIGQYLKIWNLRVQKNLNIEKITFKVVQMKFLAMHVTNQKLSFDIYGRKFTKYLHGTWS